MHDAWRSIFQAEELGAEGYFETSATSEEGVNELFLSICQVGDSTLSFVSLFRHHTSAADVRAPCLVWFMIFA